MKFKESEEIERIVEFFKDTGTIYVSPNVRELSDDSLQTIFEAVKTEISYRESCSSKMVYSMEDMLKNGPGEYCYCNKKNPYKNVHSGEVHPKSVEKIVSQFKTHKVVRYNTKIYVLRYKIQYNDCGSIEKAIFIIEETNISNL